MLALVALIAWLLTPSLVRAVTLTLQDVPSNIEKSTEFEASVSITCSSCNASYIRGVFFYPQDSTNYSGFTQNNASEWVETESDRTKYYRVDDSSSFSGKLKFKFNAEKDIGPYFFKVGRYTSANDSSAEWSDSVALTVTGPSPTPTPLPAATSTPNPTNTPKPTSTPKPDPTNTPKPTAKPTPTKIPVTVTVPITSTPAVLSVVITIAPEPSPTPAKAKTNLLYKFAGGFLMAMGLGTIGVAGYLGWRKLKSYLSG